MQLCVEAIDMTVAELIAELEKMPPEVSVYVGEYGSQYVRVIRSANGNVLMTGKPPSPPSAPAR